jgi:K+-transporting ATPase c subunit
VIGVRLATYQVPRVAKARGLPEDQVRALVESHTTGWEADLLGEPRVNVLLLDGCGQRLRTNNHQLLVEIGWNFN